MTDIRQFKKKGLALFISGGAAPSSKEAISELSDAIIESDLTLIEPEVDHLFHGGMYARTIYIPRGVVLTGREHYEPHLNFLSKGKVAVTINGESHIFTAPAIIPAEADTAKAFVALEDTEWTTVHICSSTDVDEAEKELMADVPEHIVEANKRAVKLHKYDTTPALAAGERKWLDS